jgi:protein O-mannosyl-transferase
MKHCTILFISSFLFTFSGFSQATKGAGVQNAATSTNAPQGTVYALIVGVSDYQYKDTYDPLQYADIDGRNFYHYLVSSKGGNVKKENIDTLFNDQATQSSILIKIEDYIEKLKKDDIFYFYFSGHGDAVNAEFTVLLPYDAPPSRGKKEKNHYRTGMGVVQVSTLKNMFKDIKLKGAKVIFISDACRTNELAGGVEGGNDLFKRIMEEDAGEVRLTSCSANQVSYEGVQWGGGRGLFSFYLVNGLKGLADKNNDGNVTLRELDRYLQDMVEEQTYDQETGMAKQVPQVSCSFSNCETIVLNVVDPKNKQKLFNEMERSVVPTDLIAGRGKGVQLSSSMRALGKEEIYRAFTECVRKGQLIGESSAHHIYLEVLKDPSIPDELKKEFRNLLCNNLLNDVNKVINRYLNASDNHKIYTTEYFLNAHNKLQLYKEISPTYHYNKLITDVNLLFLKGHSYYTSPKTYDVLEGLAKIDSAVALNPEAAYLYNVKGIFHQQLKQYREADKAFRKANELAPNWLYPVINIGMIFNIQNQRDSSFRYLHKALSMDSTHARTYTFIAYVHEMSKQIDSALYYYDQGLKLDKDDPELLVLKSYLLYKNGQKEQALKNFEKAMTFKSTFTTTYIDAAQGCLRYHVDANGSYDTIVYFMNAIIQADPENPAAYRNLSYYLSELELYDLAITYLNYSYAYDTLNTDTWNAYAIAYQKKNSLDTAELFIRYSLMLDDNYAQSHAHAGYIYFMRENIPQSLYHYGRAFELDPWNEVFVNWMAYLNYLQGDYEKAIGFYKRQLGLTFEPESVYLGLSRCYGRLGKAKEAVQELDRIKTYYIMDFIHTDEDYNAIRKSKEYKLFVKELNKVKK